MKGIIFDFNGTMFQDSDLHESAWIHMIKQYAKEEISDEEILRTIHGRTNDEIIKKLISPDLSAGEVAILGMEKEKNYRMLCVQDEQRVVLTDGLPAVLDKLKESKIPMTIATATTKENVDFYFDRFELSQWFDFEKVVYDDGSFPGKPEPDIFIKAAKKIDVRPENCLVFEDSYFGILAASKAKIGKIIAIDNAGSNQKLFDNPELNIAEVMKDFTTFKL
ncbi:pesticidal protein Cry10Aa [Enterococcus sp. JM4C]|uniref:HAD family hydrolase n=1 Tax=Candidatus Enterococcus huntleyi TaxID=1857217 RepID=UPI001379A6C6|nr:HAD family phosphatase [Enterococcus sp. JM4C]KAF1299643.1 pesticidal protein Cry10Aa [Enterococcus sp. JM4C]